MSVLFTVLADSGDNIIFIIICIHVFLTFDVKF